MTFSIGVLAWAIPLIIASGGVGRIPLGIRRPGGRTVYGPRYLPEQSNAEANGARHHRVAGRAMGGAPAGLDRRGDRDCRACRARCGARRSPRYCCSSRTCRTAIFHLDRAGVVQPLRVADRARRRLSRGQRLVGCGSESCGIRERGDRRRVAGRDAAGGEGVFDTSEPRICGNQRSAAARDEHPNAVVGAHQRFARVLETRNVGAKILPSPVMRESTALAEYWHGGGRAPVWYCRIPLAAISSWWIRSAVAYTRTTRGRFPAKCSSRRASGCPRSGVDRFAARVVCRNWMAPDAGNAEHLRAARAIGRHRAHPESHRCRAARARRRKHPDGGRKPAKVSLTLGERVIDEWDVPPGGRFFKRISLEPGMLAGDGPFTRLWCLTKATTAVPIACGLRS